MKTALFKTLYGKCWHVSTERVPYPLFALCGTYDYNPKTQVVETMEGVHLCKNCRKALEKKTP